MRITKHPLVTGDADRRLQNIPPDRSLVERLEQSFRALVAEGSAMPDRFYGYLFGEHPEVRRLFPADMTEQKWKLMDVLKSVFENLIPAEPARARLEELGRSHVGYGAVAAHYPAVCDCILRAMRDVLGPAWTQELAADWSGALQQVCTIILEAAGKISPKEAARLMAEHASECSPRFQPGESVVKGRKPGNS